MFPWGVNYIYCDLWTEFPIPSANLNIQGAAVMCKTSMSSVRIRYQLETKYFLEPGTSVFSLTVGVVLFLPSEIAGVKNVLDTMLHVRYHATY